MNNNISGIYCIENIINNKKYIGASINIQDRNNHHFAALKKNNHYNPYLQKEWNEFGENSYILWIVEENLSLEELDEKEIYYIRELKSHFTEWGYNVAWGGTAGNLFEGYTHKEESKKQIGNSVRGEKNGFYGRKHTDETRKKMKASHKDYSGENHPQYGKKHSKELREQNSKVQQGSKNRKNTTSKYVGVAKTSNNSWSVHITHERKTYYLGRYKTEIEAALVYNKKALEIFGPNAKLNIILHN